LDTSVSMEDPWQHFLEMAALDSSSSSSSSPVVGQSSLYSSSSAEFGQASSGLIRPHQQPGDFMQVNLIDFSDNIGSVSVANVVREPVLMAFVPSPKNLMAMASPVSEVSDVSAVAPTPSTSVRFANESAELAAVGLFADGKVGHIRNYKLSDYWPLSPVLWFEQAESAFAYYGENLSRDRYHRVLLALPESVLKTVSDIVSNPPVVEAYECLKDRLLASVRISDYQKADRLMAMPTLGDRRPSDMMASMLDQCPRGWTTENLFKHLFLSRLPQHLRVLLRTRDTADLRALAETADELYDLHLPSTVGQVNACLISSQDVPVLAAVSGGQKFGGQKSGGQKFGGQHSSGQKSSSQGGPGLISEEQKRLNKEAQLASGYCWQHWTFGGKAYKNRCVKPCAWVN